MYNYEELKNSALENPTFENCKKLHNWFERNDMYGRYWNGEYYDLDGKNFRPIFSEELNEYDCFDIVGYYIDGVTVTKSIVK